MSHELLQLLAKLLVYILLLLLPVLVVTYSESFRKPLTPDNYAILLAIMTAVGVLLFLPAISIVAATALLALGIAWLYGHYALSGISYQRLLSPARLFQGDEAELSIRLVNRKPLPLSWLSMIDPIQHGLSKGSDHFHDLLLFSGGIELLDNLGFALVNQVAIGPFQTLERTYRIEARRRGVYSMGPAHLTAGDPFGIFRREAKIGGREDIVVYPRIFRPEDIGLPFREALGEASTQRALVEDPIRIAGAREYQPGDPLRRMHWKATARTGELQVRLFDPSTTAHIIVVTNLNTFQHVWQGVDLDRMESTIDVAASIALWALDRGFAVGVRSNGIVAGTELTPRLAPGAGPRQPVLVLEHMARLSFSGRFSPEYVLLDESRRLTAGSSIIFVTSIITPKVVELLTSRRLTGRSSVVYCGRFAAPVIRGVPIYLATPPMRVSLDAVS